MKIGSGGRTDRIHIHTHRRRGVGMVGGTGRGPRGEGLSKASNKELDDKRRGWVGR